MVSNRSKLLALPAELRLLIWSHAVVQPNGIRMRPRLAQDQGGQQWLASLKFFGGE